MKVTLVNFSNKKRSKKARQELKDFATFIAEELRVDSKIKHIKMRYTRKWSGYYPKGKPLAGFFKAYRDGVTNIDFTGHWDFDRQTRLEAIVHELTHAKQLIEKRLVVYKNGRQMKWNGKYTNQWKDLKIDMLDSMDADEVEKYIIKCLPWEKEVHKNIDKYVRSRNEFRGI